MKIEEYACVKWKRVAQERMEEKMRGLSEAQVLEYHRKALDRLKAKQDAIRSGKSGLQVREDL